MRLLLLGRRIYPAKLFLLFSSSHAPRGNSSFIMQITTMFKLVFARQVTSIVNCCVFALSASDFLLLAQMKVTKEKGTPNRFLIQ